MHYKILIVDDDPECLELVKTTLESTGYSVLEAEDGESAIELTKTRRPDLIVLDRMLPDISGIDICKILKSEKKTKFIPILMLTARKELQDKIAGFETGADDYLTKPFETKELVVRIKALLRRSEYVVYGQEDVLKRGSLRVDIERHLVFVDGKKINLRPKEYDLLYLLARKPGRVLAKDYLLETVWGFNCESTLNTLEVHIHNLRKKAGKKVGSKILTVERVGYKFSDLK